MLVPNLSQTQTGVIGSFIPAFVARLRLTPGRLRSGEQMDGAATGQAALMLWQQRRASQKKAGSVGLE